jgi:hypothetical protein
MGLCLLLLISVGQTFRIYAEVLCSGRVHVNADWAQAPLICCPAYMNVTTPQIFSGAFEIEL